MAVASRRSLAVQRVPIHPRRVSREFESFLTDPALRGFWHPKYYLPGSSHIPDLSGRGHHARFGSSGGTDTNDPFVAPVTDNVQFARFTGVAGNNISTPHSEALTLTTEADIRCAVALDDWTPPTTNVIFTKGTGSTGYTLSVISSGLLRFTAINIFDANSTVAPSVSDRRLLLFRTTFRRDNGAAQREIKFFTKPTTRKMAFADAESNTGWVQLGATVTGTVNGPTASTSPAYIGRAASTDTLQLTGNLYALVVKAVIDGPTVASTDFTDRSKVKEPFQTFTDAQGNVWTLNYSSDPTVGRRMLVADYAWSSYDGVDDYHEIPDHDDLDINPGENFTLAMVIRGQPGITNSDSRRVLRKSSFTGAGYSVLAREDQRRLQWIVRDASNVVSSCLANGVWVPGKRQVFIGEFERMSTEAVARLFIDGELVLTGGAVPIDFDMRNIQPLRFGTSSETVSVPYNGLFGGVAILKKILTADEKIAWAELLRSI